MTGTNADGPEPTTDAEDEGPDLAYLRIYEEPTGFSYPAPFDEENFEPGMSAEERQALQNDAEE